MKKDNENGICSICNERKWLVVEIESEDTTEPNLREKIKCRCATRKPN